MKKLLCVLLAALMLLCLAACEKPSAADPTEPEKQTVTVYVPVSIVQSDATGQTITVQYIYEEGWQTKETFVVQLRSENSASSVGYDMIFGNKTVRMDYGQGGQTIDMVYNEKGQTVSQTVTFPEGASVTQSVTLFTYDARGRMTVQESQMYYAGQAEPVVSKTEYTYTDTESGSKGTCTTDYIVQEMHYDADDRLIRTVTFTWGNEVTRSEYAYDEHGNQIKVETYVSGTLTSSTVNTFAAYEVTSQQAQQMPYFRQGK